MTAHHPHFPALLQHISPQPKQLYVKGNVELLAQPQIAIVGSRQPTPQGIATAKEFAYLLAKAGLVITSGLAIGIDGAAHQGALAASGHTIAVLANGLQPIYPRRHQSLANAIVTKGGALVSELPPGTPAKRALFPQRNRIITGLSLGVLIVEATLKSGSLISAKLALEQNRDVFAIPGPIHSPLAAGCNWLISQGATLVTQPQDILSALPFAATNPLSCTKIEAKTPPGLDSGLASLLECVDFSPTAIEVIQHRAGLKFERLSTMLLSLELRGYINRVTAGYLRIDKPGIHQTVEPPEAH